MPESAIDLNSLAEDWQASLRAAYREPLELLSDLAIAPDQIDCLEHHPFNMLVPRGFAARMQRGNAADPLLLQVLPRKQELHTPAGFSTDPLQESRFQATPGLIHKYQGRALLIATGACGVHCRYCFRREFDYAEARGGRDGWQLAVEALRGQSDIHEAILSGGDPLSLSDSKLARLLRQLYAIGHLRRLRIHSRQPVVLPERITPALLQILRQCPWPCVLVLHCNHAQEINQPVIQACLALKSAGVTLLNQAVLLAGINDSAQSQANLGEALLQAGVLPYYLHQLDPVVGASHFQVADQRAHGIMRDLNAQAPGYLVPRLVRETPGQTGKMPLNWAE